jgi:hydroxyethylthiazole kinase-like uncharacterized protein yjeF
MGPRSDRARQYNPADDNGTRIIAGRRLFDGFELMCRAGQAGIDCLRHHWPAAAKLRIYCGSGNNAGDGYVVAALATEAGLDVEIAALGDPDSLRGDAAEARAMAVARNVPIANWQQDARRSGDCDLIVDALFGTGLTRPLEGRYAAAVAEINDSGRPVLALDCPSGLDSDTGLPRGSAVRASVTITFVGLKQGFFLGHAPDYCGALEFSDLDIPPGVTDDAAVSLERITESVLRPLLDPRLRSAHKGMNGNVLFVGGAPGTSGAIRLAAEAGLRAGAGLVHVATHPDSVAAVMAGRPEIMCRGVEDPGEISAWLAAADTVVLGPGLGRTEWSRGLFNALIAAPLPIVLDADALNLLSEQPMERDNWLLTPHPGEAGRLLGRAADDIQADRLASVRALALRYGATVILKGACSLIGEAIDNEEVAVGVCDRGNPGMATAGMGDVLSGVAGALIAQTGQLPAAARAAVLVHALAGDDAARDGERGLIASDLLPFIRARVNPA